MSKNSFSPTINNTHGMEVETKLLLSANNFKFTHKSRKDAIEREIPYQVYLKRHTDRLFVKRVKKQNFAYFVNTTHFVLCQY